MGLSKTMKIVTVICFPRPICQTTRYKYEVETSLLEKHCTIVKVYLGSYDRASWQIPRE